MLEEEFPPSACHTLHFSPDRPASDWKRDISWVFQHPTLSNLRIEGDLPTDAARAVVDLVRTHPGLSALALVPDRLDSRVWREVAAAVVANPRISALCFHNTSGCLHPSTASSLQSREAPLALWLRHCDPCLPFAATGAGIGEYPCVRSLHLAQPVPGDPAPITRIIRAFPCLESLELEQMGAPETMLPPGRPALPARTCTSLRIARAPSPSLCGVLWRMPSLEQLTLASIVFSPEDGHALAQCLRRGDVPLLRVCRLAECHSIARSVPEVVAALLSGCCPLEELELDNVRVPWEGKPLAALGRVATLRRFSALESNIVEEGEDSGVEDAFAGPTSLRVVRLAGLSLGGWGEEEQEQMLVLGEEDSEEEEEGDNLASPHNATDRFCAMLVDLLRGSPDLTSLKAFTTHGVGLRGSDAQVIARVLATGLPLQRLDLGGNSLGGEGAIALLRAVPGAAALTCLTLSGAVIAGDCADQLAASLSANCSLRELDLGRLEGDVLGVGAPIYAAVCRHPTLRCFWLETGFGSASAMADRAELRQMMLDNVTCRSQLPLAEQVDRERVLNSRWPLRVGDAVKLWHSDSDTDTDAVGVVEQAPRLCGGYNVLPARVRWPTGATTSVKRWDLGSRPRHGLDMLWRLQDRFWTRSRSVAEAALGCGGARAVLRQLIPDEV